jgi:phosphate/sulfate permease
MRPKSPQAKDVQNDILLAWVLTLPVCVLLGAGIFSGMLPALSPPPGRRSYAA